MEIEEIASRIVAVAMKVHTALGPGLLESAYQKCMVYELAKDGVAVACEVILPVRYEGIDIDAGYRIDMLVGDSVIIEKKRSKSFFPFMKHNC